MKSLISILFAQNRNLLALLNPQPVKSRLKTENRKKSVETLVSSPAPLFDQNRNLPMLNAYEELDQLDLSSKQRQKICRPLWGLKAKRSGRT